MKNKGLIITIVGLAVVALALVLLVPMAMAYGPENRNGLGLNQIVNQTGLDLGRDNWTRMQSNRQAGARNEAGPRQGMMHNSEMMRGRGPGHGLMQDGPMMRDGMQRGQGRGNNGAGLGLGAPSKSLVGVVAEQLGLDQADLMVELQSGQTMADVIAEHDVELETVVDAFLAPRAEQLAAKVADETLTQTQADSYLAMMRAKVTQQLQSEWSAGRGAGPGNGRAHCNGNCDRAGQGQGPNYVDEDGDGVCDHARTGSGRQDGGRMGGGR